MKEYWVNVYKHEGLGAMLHASLKDAICSSHDGICNRAIYRLHVKIKSKRGLTRVYPYKWLSGKAVLKGKQDYGKVHSKWLDW